MIKAVLPLAVSMICGTASAASITLVPTNTAVQVGDTVTVEIRMDFTDVYTGGNGTVGGGVDVMFDNTKLTYQSYQAGSTGDSGFRRNPDDPVDGNKLVGIAAGGLGEIDLSGGDQSSPALGATDIIGQLTFTAIAIGDAALSVNKNVNPAGGFWSFQNEEIVPTYTGSSVQIVEAVAVCRADIDGDGTVHIGDYSILSAEFGRFDCSDALPCRADIDGDGTVHIGDYSILSAEFGRFDCP